MKCRCTVFQGRVGLVRSPQKAHYDTLRRTCIFVSSAICGSCSAFLCVSGVNHERAIFQDRVGLVLIPQKAHRDSLQWAGVFASGAICRWRSVFWCVRGVKHWRTIFRARVGLVCILQKACWDMLRWTCIFASEGETSTHYFSCSFGPCAIPTKSLSEYITLNLCFSIWWDLWVT
jgi:hypothetical protein